MQTFLICCLELNNTRKEDYKKYQAKMISKIRYLFKAKNLDEVVSYEGQRKTQDIIEAILKKKSLTEQAFKCQDLKTYIKKEGPQPYIPIRSLSTIEKYLENAKESIVVEFFHGKSSESIRAKLKGIDSTLEKRQKELKYIISELNEFSLFNPMGVISKASKSQFSEFEDSIVINLVVSDPLVDSSKEYPLYYEQVDIANHIEKLRQTSISDYSLSIRVKRCHATRQEMLAALRSEERKEKTLIIVQIFTRVEKVGSQIMISLENDLGQQVWEDARALLINANMDLLIIIGIGAHLLEQIVLEVPLILLTSVSVEENSVGDFTYSRDRFALTFLENLYLHVFRRQSLSFCISEARKYANEYVYNYLWCCCLHNHAQDCKWQQIVRRIGNQQAHRLFKHSFEEWKALKFYPINNALQQMILGANQTCSKDNICCWNRMSTNKLELHQNINKILIWNEKSYELDFGVINSSKCNKLQSQIYDKPIHRTRPLTIYRILKLISLNKICILRIGLLTQARRFLTQAYEYLRCREKDTFFFELEMYKQIKLQNQIWNFVHSVKDLNKNITKVKLFISIIQKDDLNLNYEPFMKNHEDFIQSTMKVYSFQVSLHFVVITSNPSFDGEYATFTLTSKPDIKEKYYQVLHKFKYENISPDNKQSREHLQSLRQQILHGTISDKQQIKEKCEQIKQKSENAYYFLGFLSLFGEDGLYLTKSTSIIIEHLFTKKVVEDAIHQKLPLQSFAFTNCIQLQISKPYREYFQNESIALSEILSQKLLLYYNILLKLYLHFLQPQIINSFTSFVKKFIKKEGLFCINISPKDQIFDEIVAKIHQLYKNRKEINEIFYNNAIFKPIYHINKIQKILEDTSKKKKIKQFQTINITSVNEQQLQSTILLWNIILNASVFLLTLENQFEEKVKRLRMMIIVFFLKGEVKHTIVQIAKIQLGLLIDQRLKKFTVGINHQQLSQLLTYYHVYSIKLSALKALRAQWGNTHKFKEILYNCFALVYKLKESCEILEVQAEFSRLNLTVMISELVWYRQLMKLIQKKTLFYFNFIKMIRSQRYMRSNRIDQEKDFHKHLNLGEIRYEFQNLYLKFPSAYRNEADFLLIDHYIKISLNEANADNTLLFSLKNNISPELQSIYQHLCLKVDKKTLFDKKRLVIFARARSSFINGKPYIFNRKRYLTVPYLNTILQGTSLRSSYFNLNSKTFPQLYNTNLSEILYLIVNIDSEDSQQLQIGSQSFVESENITVEKFAAQLIKLPIKILILIGKNAVRVCEKIRLLYDDNKRVRIEHFKAIVPIIISLESGRFSMNDQQVNQFPVVHPSHAWNYLSNQVYLIGVDLVVLSIVSKINEGLRGRKFTFTQDKIINIVNESIRLVKNILSSQFQCVQDSFDTFCFKVWADPTIIEKIQEGIIEDLTSKFYSSEYNFYHYNYYENVGRCKEIYNVLKALYQKKHIVEIFGTQCTGKTTLLHEASWTAQIKNLFEFGISIFDVKQNSDSLKQFIGSCKFKEREVGGNQSCLMISIDNLDENFLERQKQIIEKLKNKSITILFTAQKQSVGVKLKAILLNADGSEEGKTLSIDMNKIERKDIYGQLMSNIKDSSQIDSMKTEKRYTKKAVNLFQKRVDDVMEKIVQSQQGRQIIEANELLKGKSPMSSEKKHEIFYNFYKQNYENLIVKLKEKKELRVKIV